MTSRSLRLQTAKLAYSLIPAALQNEPVFLSIDDTTVPKFGKKSDAVSVLHDHACHTGKPYVNGHCFVSLTMSVPALNQCEGKATLIRYVSPFSRRIPDVDEGKTRLGLAGGTLEEVMPLKIPKLQSEELRSHISWQIQREIFLGNLVAKAKTEKNPTDLVRPCVNLLRQLPR